MKRSRYYAGEPAQSYCFRCGQLFAYFRKGRAKRMRCDPCLEVIRIQAQAMFRAEVSKQRMRLKALETA